MSDPAYHCLLSLEALPVSWYTVRRAVGSNFQLVRPRYCDHNTAACNRQGVGVVGGCSPFARSAEAFNNVFILENSTLYYSNIQACAYAPVDGRPLPKDRPNSGQAMAWPAWPAPTALVRLQSVVHGTAASIQRKHADTASRRGKWALIRICGDNSRARAATKKLRYVKLAATIWVRRLFEGGVWSRKYGRFHCIHSYIHII